MTDRSGFRGDVEGLRAVAVALVVAFHAGAGAVSGGYVGVDVFFVLSGFLITGLLLRELQRTGTVSLRTFWARRVRRLLPMSTLVLVVTAVASYRILPPLDGGGLAADVRAGALYVANWHFAAESTHYMADTDKSPLLHYWSLAVEEQFYLVWPLLLLVLVGGRVTPWPHAVRRVAVALAVIGAVSLALSVTTSATSGPFAYFGLHTRAWELAAGAAVALVGARAGRLPRGVALAVSWTGLALVVGSALALDARTPFPGSAALLPVTGTALLLLAGLRAGRGGAGWVLDNPVLRYVGRLSYAWYLWHWPCLVLGAALVSGSVTQGVGALPLGGVLAAVVLSFGLAVVSHHALEQPVRRAAWLVRVRSRALVLGTALTAVAVLAASGPLVAAAGRDGSGGVASVALTDLQPSGPGAARSIVLDPPTAQRPDLTPEQARADRQDGATSCHAAPADTEAPADCLFGDPEGERVVVLLGDSHADHWLPALDRLAEQRGWQLWKWSKASCPMTEVDVLGAAGRGTYGQCDAWRAQVWDRLEALGRTDAVLLARTQLMADLLVEADGAEIARAEAPPVWEAGSREVFARLGALTDDIVVLRETPWAERDVPACLSEAPADLRHCDFPRDGGVGLDQPLYDAERRASEGSDEVSFVDMSTEICPVDPCPAVARDGTVMFHDRHHLTVTFSERLAEPLGRKLAPILDAAQR